MRYGEHFLPPGVAVRELGTGQSRKAMLASLGIKATVVPAASIEDGINAVRNPCPLMGVKRTLWRTSQNVCL